MSIDRKRLLSHRLRGFGDKESTVVGLQKALEQEVCHVEFDVRVTKDLVLVAYHDPGLINPDGQYTYLDDVTLADLRSLPSGAHIATLNELAACLNAHPKTSTKLHIDIKISGLEDEIVKILGRNNVIGRTVFVSWMPSVLKRIHETYPNATLCFSHISFSKFTSAFWLASQVGSARLIGRLGAWCSKFDMAYGRLISSIDLEFSRDGRISFEAPTGNCRSRGMCGCIVKSEVEGEMRELLAATNGYVCVPHMLIGRREVENYKASGISVAVFSARNAGEIENINSKLNPDLIYADCQF